ncbi:AP2 domain-containing protein [Acetobacterium wieringae]|uniref:AP2 domain-containing protein n=1 Tax=Acetobacterium wieringae TaxID=52694 RepID=UPI002033CC9F|nr:AP2 domain-containing protein [Acetobacterium wieringae]URN85894.1 hypothetical protein CHL1_001570 [Acetobacterium wieringae]
MGKIRDLKNMRFGNLTVIERSGSDKSGNALWLCQCKCGNTKVIPATSLISERTKSCGCLDKELRKSKQSITIGDRFGSLVVLEKSHIEGRKQMWKCQCDCGNMTFVSTGNLKNGATESCGCSYVKSRSKNLGKAREKINESLVEGTDLTKISSDKLPKSNTSGIKGVVWDKSRQKWIAQITFKGKNINLGRYDDIKEASKARAEAENKYFKPILEKYKGEK